MSFVMMFLQWKLDSPSEVVGTLKVAPSTRQVTGNTILRRE